MIPYSIMLFSMLTTGDGELSSSIGVIMSAFSIVSLLFSYITSNILMVNQGMIYYSILEQDNHVQALSEIDLIGQDVE